MYNDVLFEAVREQLGCKSETDFITTCRKVHESDYGAMSGFSGFIANQDTCKFARNNMSLIVDALAQDADERDMSISQMIASFKWLGVGNTVEVETYNFERIFWGVVYDQNNINEEQRDVTRLVLNALAWWTLEHVAFRVACEAECEEQEFRRQ
mgnify:CR=1 FL=1